MEQPLPQFFTRLPFQDRGNPAAVVVWIQRNVPCFKGDIPGDWTDAVISFLRKETVANDVIRNAMLYLRDHGYHFTPTVASAAIGLTVVASRHPPNPDGQRPYPRPAAPRMDQGEPLNEFSVKNAVQQYEHSYIRAQTAGDLAGMEVAVLGILTLLWKWINAKLEVAAERAKWDAIREEVLRNAPRIAPLIQHLSREDLRRLRELPAPRDLQNLRIVIRLPSRNARARRAK